MTFDLAKRSHPEPDPGAAGEDIPAKPETNPRKTEEEELRKVLREEVLAPLKALVAAVASGSPVLARWIVATIWKALKAASRTQSSEAKPAAPAETQESRNKGEKSEKAEDDTPAASTARTTGPAGIGDVAERLAMGLFVAALGLSVLGGVLAGVWVYVAPYRGWIVAALIIAWCTGAVCFAPEEAAHTEDDHDENAGEQPEESPVGESGKPAGEPWEVIRDRLVRYVEERVAECAEGHREGLRGKGARVDDLLAEQQENGGLPGYDRKAMTVLLQRAGLTVRDQMKFHVLTVTPEGGKWRQQNVPGVHVDDLAKSLGRRVNLPPHLVPDKTPGPRVISASKPATDSPPDSGGESAENESPDAAVIPMPRAAGE